MGEACGIQALCRNCNSRLKRDKSEPLESSELEAIFLCSSKVFQKWQRGVFLWNDFDINLQNH